MNKITKSIDTVREKKLYFKENVGEDAYKIVSLMVVNKVFDSYFKKVDFKIITFDELKKIVE